MATPKKLSTPVFARAFPLILIICSAIALVSSFVLTYDKMEILKDPHFVPNCNLNPVLSCSDVMNTPQSSAFGFPNPWLGLIAFAAFLVVGITLLAGASMKRWFWFAFEAGLGLAMIFAYWLLFESIYVIGALCPYCLAVDVVLTTMFWYATLYLFEQRHLSLPKKWQPVLTFAQQHHAEILVTWFIIFIALVLQHFWYYYGQFL